MAVYFTEYFLDITMEYEGKVGYKGYNMKAGAEHELDASLSSTTRQVNKQSVDSYNQTVAPISQVMGYEPEVIKLEGVLCHETETDAVIARITGHRKYPTLYNTFLPCSLLTGGYSSTIPEVRGKNWYVDFFKIKRSTQKPSLILYELTLGRWYDTITVQEE